MANANKEKKTRSEMKVVVSKDKIETRSEIKVSASKEKTKTRKDKKATCKGTP
jgi:hypothetical protein